MHFLNATQGHEEKERDNLCDVTARIRQERLHEWDTKSCLFMQSHEAVTRASQFTRSLLWMHAMGRKVSQDVRSRNDRHKIVYAGKARPEARWSFASGRKAPVFVSAAINLITTIGQLLLPETEPKITTRW